MTQKTVPAWHHSDRDGWYELNETEYAHVCKALDGLIPKIKSHYEARVKKLEGENVQLREELKAAYGVKDEFVDLSQVRGSNSRYKAYDDLLRRGDELCNEVFLDTTHPLNHITTKEELLDAFGLPQHDFSILDKYGIMEPPPKNVVKIEDMDEAPKKKESPDYKLLYKNLMSVKNMFHKDFVFPPL